MGTATTPWNASVNELYSPTMRTLFGCYSELAQAFQADVAPTILPAGAPISAPTPVPAPFETQALNLSTPC
jgi:hypothetical protein